MIPNPSGDTVGSPHASGGAGVRGSPRVVILLARVGGGHESVARALVESLVELAGPELAVERIDVYAPSCSRWPLTALPSAYHRSVTRLPCWCFGAFYRLSDRPGSFGLIERLARPCIQPGLRRLLARARPDVVVRVVPGLGGAVTGALAAIGSQARVVTVVTDLVTIHTGWVTGESAAYAVPTPEAAAAVRAAGVPAARVHYHGLPVPGAFGRRPPERAGLRRRLGLGPDRPTLLLMSGGEGGGRLEALARALATACPGAQLVVVAGRNDLARRRLVAHPPPVPCRVLGYVGDVADWMRAADLLVTKAGPSTVMEAIHAGLPMLLTDSLPQEEGTLSYLLAHGAAARGAGTAETATVAAELLGRPERLASLRRSAEVLRRPEAARATAALILRHAGAAVPELAAGLPVARSDRP
jgi:1,2-diacylglycerol 3-beta-galactosyltransferase